MDLNGIGLAPKSSKDMILRRSFRAKSEGKRATRNAKYQELKGPMDLVIFSTFPIMWISLKLLEYRMTNS